LGGEAAKCREALILGKRNRPQGSGTARLSALPNAVLSTVHAGGEQGWKSRRYIDHDDPRAPHLSDKTSSWLENGISSSRASLSPEPDMFLDY